jgi:hypothetical protein
MIVDFLLGAFLVAGYLAMRRLRPPVVHDVPAAFQVLDRSIQRFVPDMPTGYTWREAVERLKGSGVKIDWAKMESSLAEYEAFRYGVRPIPKGGEDEVVRLSMKIRGRISGYGSKGKSTRSD